MIEYTIIQYFLTAWPGWRWPDTTLFYFSSTNTLNAISPDMIDWELVLYLCQDFAVSVSGCYCGCNSGVFFTNGRISELDDDK